MRTQRACRHTLSFLSQQAQGKRYDSGSFVTTCLISFFVELRNYVFYDLSRVPGEERPEGKALREALNLDKNET